MPKRSEIELRSNDSLISDVPDEIIERVRLKATGSETSFSRYGLHLIADHFQTPREAFASATVIVLVPE